jgi:hypothetical protein
MKPDFLTTPNVWLRASRTHTTPEQYGQAITYHPRKRSPSRLLTFIFCAVAVLSFAYLVAEKVS